MRKWNSAVAIVFAEVLIFATQPCYAGNLGGSNKVSSERPIKIQQKNVIDSEFISSETKETEPNTPESSLQNHPLSNQSDSEFISPETLETEPNTPESSLQNHPLSDQSESRPNTPSKTDSAQELKIPSITPRKLNPLASKAFGDLKEDEILRYLKRSEDQSESELPFKDGKELGRECLSADYQERTVAEYIKGLVDRAKTDLDPARQILERTKSTFFLFRRKQKFKDYFDSFKNIEPKVLSHLGLDLILESKTLTQSQKVSAIKKQTSAMIKFYTTFESSRTQLATDRAKLKEQIALTSDDANRLKLMSELIEHTKKENLLKLETAEMDQFSKRAEKDYKLNNENYPQYIIGADEYSSSVRKIDDEGGKTLSLKDCQGQVIQYFDELKQSLISQSEPEQGRTPEPKKGIVSRVFSYFKRIFSPSPCAVSPALEPVSIIGKQNTDNIEIILNQLKNTQSMPIDSSVLEEPNEDPSRFIEE